MDKAIKGDLIKLALSGQFDVIIHGCNCFNTMGAGIAKSIALNFPEAFAADQNTNKGDRLKLGSYSYANVVRPDASFTVINAYTQFDWRGRGTKVDYDAIKCCFKEIATNFTGLRIGYPLIGAGLAGGDWKIISKHINSALKEESHNLVIFQS